MRILPTPQSSRTAAGFAVWCHSVFDSAVAARARPASVSDGTDALPGGGEPATIEHPSNVEDELVEGGGVSAVKRRRLAGGAAAKNAPIAPASAAAGAAITATQQPETTHHHPTQESASPAQQIELPEIRGRSSPGATVAGWWCGRRGGAAARWLSSSCVVPACIALGIGELPATAVRAWAVRLKQKTRWVST